MLILSHTQSLIIVNKKNYQYKIMYKYAVDKKDQQNIYNKNANIFYARNFKNIIVI